MGDIKKEHLGEAVIVLLYFALKPLYLSSSGVLQISDIVLLSSVAFLIIRSHGRIGVSKDHISVVKSFMILLLYQFFINAIWSFITGDATINWHDLYYLFNFLAFVYCVNIGQKNGIEILKKSIGIGSFFAVIVTAIGLVFFHSVGTRSTGFFNNPNQLGYFAVIMLTVIAICKDKMSRLQIVVIFAISFWSTIVSLSKAAILSYFVEVVVLILFYQNDRSIKRLAIEFAMLFIVGAMVYLFFFSDSDLVLKNGTLSEMRYRILYMSEENDSNLAYGRGYARILEMLPHIIWGTGEGAYERFTARHGTEVHSTFISLLTCYGLIGLGGYLAFFKKCMGNGKVFVQNLIALSGMFLYAISHNGIRNTLLWMIMAVLLLETSYANRTQMDNI